MLSADECFGDNAHKEHCNVSWKNLSTRTRKFARVTACGVSVLFTLCGVVLVVVVVVVVGRVK